jgi:hypothetical protein
MSVVVVSAAVVPLADVDDEPHPATIDALTISATDAVQIPVLRVTMVSPFESFMRLNSADVETVGGRGPHVCRAADTSRRYCGGDHAGAA